MNSPTDLEKAGTPGREQAGQAVPGGIIANISGIGNGPGQEGAWFGPGRTLNPVAPEETAGRAFDYPTAYNLSIRPRAYEGVTFEQLRSFADSYDLLRLVIETRKDQIESYNWDIVGKDGKEGNESEIKAAKDFFRYPDKEHPWRTWLRMMMEEVFVIDTVAIYPRATRGGQLYNLEFIDGATIKRVLDGTGRTPLPPDPAYQQILKGLPAVDYTREELIYRMRNPRASRVYGYSPVEQIIMTVNIAMRRQLHQLQFYTEGSVPEAIAGVPETWNIETLQKFQLYWDSLMEGNTAQRRHMRFVPFDPSKMAFPKQDALKDLFDEWLARIICFCFSISPTALVKETNRATAESVQEAAKLEGLLPLLGWVKDLLDYLLQEICLFPNLEFKWDQEKGIDPLTQAKVDEIYLKSKVVTPDEVREALGKPALTQEQRDELNPPQPEPPQGKIDPLTGLPYKEPVNPIPQPGKPVEALPDASKEKPE